MSILTLTIGKQQDGAKKARKSREFSTRMLGLLRAPRFWSLAWGYGTHQPLWLTYTAAEQEARAFTANLRGGRPVVYEGGAFELASLTPYRFREQQTPQGLIVTAYIPELFDLDPPSPYLEHARFLFAPPTWWLDQQAAELEATFAEEAREAARAALFVAFLDRRTALPILADLRFHLRLYRAALEEPWIARVGTESSTDLLLTQSALVRGLEFPLGVAASSGQLAELITTQTQLFLEEEARHGKTLVPAGGRLLSYPQAPAVQLCFDFGLERRAS